ncbi:MAG: nuclear transport factor 2 family protein [Gammaproteobacteria bacterium]|nr:nuclear transport factor 2 family protein [Gammaproteobacteria bacterium]
MTAPDALDLTTQRQLEALLSEFAWRVDHGMADRVHELFTDDGEISAPGLALKGRPEIARTFGARSKNPRRVSRHFWSNPRFERLGERTVRVITAVQTYMHVLADNEALPAPVGSCVVGDSTDIMDHGSDGRWRFRSRTLDVVFRFD